MDTTVKVPIKVTHTFDRERIECLLVSAFEGGSNYWIKWAEAVDGGDIYDAAFNYGVRIRADGEPHSRLLHLSNMTTGLQCMADHYPQHMADFISGNDDATTADVFLQCCLYGEVIYG